MFLSLLKPTYDSATLNAQLLVCSVRHSADAPISAHCTICFFTEHYWNKSCVTFQQGSIHWAGIAMLWFTLQPTVLTKSTACNKIFQHIPQQCCVVNWHHRKQGILRCLCIRVALEIAVRAASGVNRLLVSPSLISLSPLLRPTVFICFHGFPWGLQESSPL